MKVSIIIPIYNVEKYLPRCIKSVFEQTYSNLEIILVDDGTKDNAGKMCDEYAQVDNRVKVIHKENEGLSAARNAGIDIATGDALFFLDSDDYLSEDCIEKCVKMLVEKEAEISIVQMLYISENTNEAIKIFENEEICEFNSEQAIEISLYQKLYTCCVPAKLYKRSVVANIRFPIGRISEDLAVCHLLINNATKIVYSNHYGYYYRQRKNSIMHVFNLKRLDALQWALEIEKFCKIYYPNIMEAAICRTFNVSIHLLLDLPDKGEIHDMYYQKIWKEIKRTRVITIKSKKVRNREKIAALLSFGGEKSLKTAWNSGFAIKRKEQ